MSGKRGNDAWSFRPLAWFWAAVLVTLGGGALVLQLLGAPTRPPAVTADASSPASAMRAAPGPASPVVARAANPDPAPALSATSLAIPEPRPVLLEPSPDPVAPGQTAEWLPRIGPNGLTPQKLYAGAFDPSERHPRVALVLDGLGLDTGLSEQASSALPSAIDFAYSAYAPSEKLLALAGEARRGGRECLVSIPMEPSFYPAHDEGGRALLTGADPDQNQRFLHAALAHVPACVGATGASDGLAGDRFAAQRTAFADMLAEVSERGLLYLDPRARAGGRENAGERRVDIVIDASMPDEPPGQDSIDAALEKLTRLAAERGSAIGVAGPPRPVLIERLAIWTHGLAARGVVLVPLTAIPLEKPASLARADGSN